MHLVYLHQHFSTRKGATGTRSYEMARRLIDAGHQVTMICGVNPATQAALETTGRLTELEIDGIRVMCIAEKYANEMGFYARVKAFYSFANEAKKVILDTKPDLIFATSTPLTVGLPAKKAAKKLNIPFVFEVRDLWPELPIALGVVKNPMIKWYLRGMEKGIYNAAQHIIALSPGIQDGICETGFSRDKTTLIPNCSDLDLFRPSDEPLNDDRFGDPNDFRLIFSGAHGLANGLDAVLDAAAVLKKRGVKGIRLIFIGQGNQRDRLIERSKAEGLDDLIIWLSFLPKNELAAILPRMDVGMMILKNIPAFYYGTSPNKFFDYIACGLPVLNNYPGWVADMIRNNDCGLVVEPDNAEAFADAVINLSERRSELREMGLRGRALAERDFARDMHGENFVKVIESAHKNRKN